MKLEHSSHAPLNLIYYGPPGTGKTYQTARQAVEIIDGVAAADRDELMRRYRELQETSQIAFVTFHQSYSYEEFVEGIRPVLRGEGEVGGDGGVEYEITQGVFRALCEAARTIGARSGAAIDLGQARFWKLSMVKSQILCNGISGAAPRLGFMLLFESPRLS